MICFSSPWRQEMIFSSVGKMLMLMMLVILLVSYWWFTRSSTAIDGQYNNNRIRSSTATATANSILCNMIAVCNYYPSVNNKLLYTISNQNDYVYNRKWRRDYSLVNRHKCNRPRYQHRNWQEKTQEQEQEQDDQCVRNRGGNCKRK